MLGQELRNIFLLLWLFANTLGPRRERGHLLISAPVPEFRSLECLISAYSEDLSKSFEPRRERGHLLISGPVPEFRSWKYLISSCSQELDVCKYLDPAGNVDTLYPPLCLNSGVGNHIFSPALRTWCLQIFGAPPGTWTPSKIRPCAWVQELGTTYFLCLNELVVSKSLEPRRERGHLLISAHVPEFWSWVILFLPAFRNLMFANTCGPAGNVDIS